MVMGSRISRRRPPAFALSLLILGAAAVASALPSPAAETWWSLRRLERPPVPEVKDRAWPRSPLDAFVLARLEAEAMAPAPPADRATLLRRLFLDLTGLPPTPSELQAFLGDDSE